MPFSELAAALQNTPFFTAVRESALAYPIILSCHLSGIALFGGTILMTDLRLLSGQPPAAWIEGLRPWKWAGLLTMAITGSLLAGAKFATYYANPYFQTKLTLLAMVGVHAWFFRRRVYGKGVSIDPRAAKLAAVCSLVLWLSILTMGRLIAYYEPAAQR